MYFDKIGLVTADLGDKRFYIPWRHVSGLWQWMNDGRSCLDYPGYEFTREQAAYIWANYEEQ